MTESEWLACIQAEELLKGLTDERDWQKIQELLGASLRRIWHLIPEGAYRQMAELAEHCASGAATPEDWNAGATWAERTGIQSHDGFGDASVHPYVRPEYHATRAVFGFFHWIVHEEWERAAGVLYCVHQALAWEAAHAVLGEGEELMVQRGETKDAILKDEERRLCDLIRDLFNPFRPVTFDPAWRTPAVLALARAISEERSFGDMPLLGDALEEAGCNSGHLLAHCREVREHLKGCWAIDLILDK
jgi:hypothetical protein